MAAVRSRMLSRLTERLSLAHSSAAGSRASRPVSSSSAEGFSRPDSSSPRASSRNWPLAWCSVRWRRIRSRRTISRSMAASSTADLPTPGRPVSRRCRPLRASRATCSMRSSRPISPVMRFIVMLRLSGVPEAHRGPLCVLPGSPSLAGSRVSILSIVTGLHP